jgi:hypothetical protein
MLTAPQSPTHSPVPQAEVKPGTVAVEVSATGVFFHGLPRVKELELAGRPWQPPRRGPGCACAAPRADEDGHSSAGSSKRSTGAALPAPPAASDGTPQGDEGEGPAETGEGDSAGVAGAAPKTTHVPVLKTSASTRRLIAQLQQPVALPVAPVLEAGAAAAAAEEGAGRSVGSEVFMFVHGLGEDFGNGEGWGAAEARGGVRQLPGIGSADAAWQRLVALALEMPGPPRAVS